MISIQNLYFHYKRQKPLFDDFSLDVEAGRIVGLLGKNGAGKSTLLKLVAGLLAPQSGKLEVAGFIPFDRNPNMLADIYMVPEEFSLPSISIAYYVRAIMPLYPAFDMQKFDNICEQFEISKADNLNRMSHGQRKKFLIALALASNCKLLIFDEPTNGLDIPSKSLFRKILVGSVTDEQLVLISTHQVKDIDTIIDKVVVIDSGKIVFQDDMATISSRYAFETVQSADGVERLIYHEKSPMGYRIIRQAADNNETVIDMELLFNAIIHQSLK